MNAPWDIAYCRSQFPALARQVGGKPAAFFDGPAGSQVPQRVIDAMGHYLAHTNANHGGEFATSYESDALLDAAHQTVADFLGASDPGEVAFGPNMTTLTFALSRALAQTWQPGDEILVSQSDHDANVTPWVLAARDAGATVRHIPLRSEDCTLDLEGFYRLLNSRTRLVALGCASNATGTIHPFPQMIEAAHAAGAEVFLDAVHYAPHLPIDVTAWQCDYLACSAYKYFGPHLGVLWGRRERLEALPAYKLRPAPNDLPGKWMTGTQSHEAIAGTAAAIEYLADLGRHHHGDATLDRRAALLAAYEGIARYERGLAVSFLSGLAEMHAFRLWGIAQADHLHERVPTFCFTHDALPSREIARRLGELGLFVWHGNYYALPLTQALGLEPEGAVRVGILHYNTAEEIDRLLEALAGLNR